MLFEFLSLKNEKEIFISRANILWQGLIAKNINTEKLYSVKIGQFLFNAQHVLGPRKIWSQ